jgi:S1-C subfamily serine protease
MQEKTSSRKNGITIAITAVIGLVLACVTVSACGMVAVLAAPRFMAPTASADGAETGKSKPTARTSPQPTAAPPGDPTTPAQPLSAADIATQLTPSIVRITVQYADGSATGSGIVFQHRDGETYILTNAHVVEGGVSVTVTPSDSRQARPARVQGISSCDDLAVLQVQDTSGLTPATFGTGAQMGETVYVLGFPLGSESLVVTSGLVSSPSQSLPPLTNVIQTDAAINAGNSGGPLVNAYGAVIGINTARIPPALAANTGFAIKSADALPTIEILISQGNLLWLGMNVSEVELDEAIYAVQVGAVAGGSPADTVGIAPGDLLIQIEDKDIRSHADVCAILRSRRDGDVVKIAVVRFIEHEIQQLAGQIAITTLQHVQPLVVTATEPYAQEGASSDATPQTPAAAQAPASQIQAVEGQLDAQAAQQNHAAQIQGYQRRFFDTFQNWRSTRWTQGQNDQIGLQLVNNVYRLTMKQPNVMNWEPWRQEQVGADYIVELSVVVGGNTTGIAAAGIGFDEQGDGGNASYFVLRSDGAWEIRTLRNGAGVPELSTRPTPSKHINVGANTNTLWVVRLPDRTEYWINAAPVAVGPASGANGGRVGVVGWSEADLTAPVAVDVDDLLIWTPR